MLIKARHAGERKITRLYRYYFDLLFFAPSSLLAQIRYQIAASKNPHIHSHCKQLRGLFCCFVVFIISLFRFVFGKCKLIFYGNLWNDFHSLFASSLSRLYIAIDNRFIAETAHGRKQNVSASCVKPNSKICRFVLERKSKREKNLLNLRSHKDNRKEISILNDIISHSLGSEHSDPWRFFFPGKEISGDVPPVAIYFAFSRFTHSESFQKYRKRY